MRLTSSINTPISNTTSFDLIENNQPKRSLLPSMSSSSMLADCQSTKQQSQPHDSPNQDKLNGNSDGLSSRDSTSIALNNLNNGGQPGYEKVNDVIIDPLTITKMDSPPPTTSSVGNMSAKSSPSLSS